MPKRKADEISASLIENTNALEAESFQKRFAEDEWLSYQPKPKEGTIPEDATCFQLDFRSADTISHLELDACFKLIESTSRHDYETSSWGWHPRRKRKEMKEAEMKYLLVKRTESKTTDIHDEKAVQLEGFLSFMLTHDSTPSVPVVYIYEIHLSESLRGLGLGAHLMSVAEQLACKVGVEKVMLTCFLSNQKALHFYQSRGYEKDESSPEDRKTRLKTTKVDYMIMSKAAKP